MDVLNYGKESVSVAFGEVKSHNWLEEAYKPDIHGNWVSVHKQPGYDMNDL